MTIASVVQVAQICTPVIAAVALLVAFTTLRRNNKLATLAAERKRAEITMEAAAAWVKNIRPSNIALRAFIKTKAPMGEGDVFKKMAFDQEFRNLVQPILERMEHLALGVILDVYDQNVIAGLAKSAILYENERFRPYIRAVRAGDVATDRDPHPTAYAHWDALCALLEPAVQAHLSLVHCVT